MNESVDPRILFAAERTFLAYLRTGLAFMGFGFVVARFGFFLRQIAVAAAPGESPSPPSGTSLLLGTALILLGVAVCASAAPWYGRTVARLQSGAGYTPLRYGLAFWVAGGVAIVGVLMVAYLLLLR
ncbi:MAG: DUF202 domain-containing protein [Armatimonadetes bacterium]|nr:DUF202 domain-containing protein [Armatimonadota bacterium]